MLHTTEIRRNVFGARDFQLMNYTPEYYQARQSQDYRSGGQTNSVAAKKATPADGEERSLTPAFFFSHFFLTLQLQNGTSMAERVTECVYRCSLAFRKKSIGH